MASRGFPDNYDLVRCVRVRHLFQYLHAVRLLRAAAAQFLIEFSTKHE